MDSHEKIYEMFMGISRQLGGIEVTLNQHTQQLQDIKTEAKRTNGRVTTLERIWDTVKAKTAIIASIVSFVASLTWAFIKGKLFI